MSSLSVFEDSRPGVALLQTQDGAEIAAALAPFGIRFERWDDVQPPPKDADEATVLATYRPWLDRLMGETGAGSADVLRVNAQTPNKEALRSKFLSEHIHSEDEVRFFVHGGGHFIMHINDRVYDVECTQGDLISVPEGYKHWFDAGPQPDMVTLRIFTHREGWVAQYTGADIARQFPSFSS